MSQKKNKNSGPGSFSRSYLELLDLFVQQVDDVELLLFLRLFSGVSLPGVRGQTVAGRQLLLADGDVLQVSPLDGPRLLLRQQLPDDGVHAWRGKKHGDIL